MYMNYASMEFFLLDQLDKVFFIPKIKALNADSSDIWAS